MTPQLHLISLNHTLTLEFINESASVVEQSNLTLCNNILSGNVLFPTSSLIFYQLRGHDISNNPFLYAISGYDDLTFQPPSFTVSLSKGDFIPVAPGQTSIINATIEYNQLNYRSVGVVIASTASSSLVSTNFIQKPQSLLGSIAATIQLEVVASSALLPGTPSLLINISITDDCKFHQQNVTIPLFVCNPINFNVTNSSSFSSVYSLLISWNEPTLVSGTLNNYRLAASFENGTNMNYEFSNTSLSYTLEHLTPYQLVFLDINAYDQLGNNVGCSSKQRFRSKESGNLISKFALT